MKKKKQLTSLSKWLLMLCMTLFVLAGVKTRVHAEPEAVTKYGLWVCDTQVTSENCNNILEDMFTTSYRASFDPATNTLHLNNANFDRYPGHTYSEGSAVIYSEIPLKITGDASFRIIKSKRSAIVSKANLDILDCSLDINGGDYGIFTYKELRIANENHSITVTGTSRSAIEGALGVQVEGGHIKTYSGADAGSEAASPLCGYGIKSTSGYVYLLGGSYDIDAKYFAVSSIPYFLNLGPTTNIVSPIGGKIIDKSYNGDAYSLIADSTGKYATKVKIDTTKQGFVTVVFNQNKTRDNNTEVLANFSYYKVGSKVTRPKDPTRDGYFFGGWYTSRDCKDGEEFDFNTEIQSYLTLYAKWNKGKQYNLWVSGIRVNDLNKNAIPVPANGTVSYDPASSTLKLNGSFGVNENSPTINKVKTFIYTGVPLKITGDADIVVDDADAYPIYSYSSNITIGGNIRIVGGNTGIFSSSAVIIDGAGTKLSITDSDTGISGESGIVINNGTVSIQAQKYGLYTKAGIISIWGGKTSIQAKTSAVYGGKERNLDVSDRVAITKPENYIIGKSKNNNESYYTIMDSDSKDAKIVVFDGSCRIYTVTFNMNGQNVAAPQAQQLADGRYAHDPGNVTPPDGFDFGGWYTDSTCTQKYVFTTPVHKSFTLYAKWDKKPNQSTAEPDESSKTETPEGTPDNDKKTETPEVIANNDKKLETPEVVNDTRIKDRESVFNIGRGRRFRVTSDDKTNPTVSFERLTDKKATRVTVPKTVTVDDVTYTVTAVSAGAFKGCRKLTSVTLSANIESIGSNAFKGCPALKTVKIQSSRLTKKSLSGKAFSGISSNATIKVPAKMKKSYGKLFTKKGLYKNVKIK